MSTVDEDALIKSRPLTGEERPFKRLFKRCSALPNLSLPPNSTAAAAAAATTTTTAAAGASVTPSPGPTTPLLPPTDPTLLTKFQSDIDLDFSHFSLTLARLQLLADTNRREIERYEHEKARILDLAEKAREDMALLRESLSEAQREKRNRVVYDEIAGRIVGDGLKGRDEAKVGIRRLEEEIRELEDERREYGRVWAERRGRFLEVVGRLESIRDEIVVEKEEHDRREGMDEEEGEEGEEIETTNTTTTTTTNAPTPAAASAPTYVLPTRPPATPTPNYSTPSRVSTPTPLRKTAADVPMADVRAAVAAGDDDRMDTS